MNASPVVMKINHKNKTSLTDYDEINKKMDTLYKCENCKYETNSRANIRRHFQGKRNEECIPEYIDDIELYINTLLVREKKYTDLSGLTVEEKEKHHKNKQQEYDFKKGLLGSKNELQYARQLLYNTNHNSISRNQEEPEWKTAEDVLKILQENQIYELTDTIYGTIQIPLKITNGYYNSAVFDRIDNDKSYSRDNIKIVPHFLNVEDNKFSKLLDEDLREILKIREELNDNLDELKQIADDINNKPFSQTFFCKLAYDAYHHSNDRKIFGFESVADLNIFIIEKFVEQGGLCPYLCIPIYPETKHKYKISLERKNPLLGYTKENTILIVAGLNGKPPGQYLNKTEFMTDELREDAVKNGSLYFNIENLHEWFKLTKERKIKYNKIKKTRSLLLKSLIDFDKLIINANRIKNLTAKKDDKVCEICLKEFSSNWALERHKSAKNPHGHKF